MPPILPPKGTGSVPVYSTVRSTVPGSRFAAGGMATEKRPLPPPEKTRRTDDATAPNDTETSAPELTFGKFMTSNAKVFSPSASPSTVASIDPRGTISGGSKNSMLKETSWTSFDTTRTWYSPASATVGMTMVSIILETSWETEASSPDTTMPDVATSLFSLSKSEHDIRSVRTWIPLMPKTVTVTSPPEIGTSTGDTIRGA